MKRRIIINILDDSVSDLSATALVGKVIEGGRISETAKRKHYCHITTFRDGIVVHAFKRTDATDSFNVWKQ